MFCKKCGSKLEEGWKVCPKCGCSVDDKESITNNQKEVKDRKILVLIGIVILVGIVIILSLLLYHYKKNSNASDKMTNTNEKVRDDATDVSKDKSEVVSENNLDGDEDEQQNIDSQEETDMEEYFLTDSVYYDDWNISIMIGYVTQTDYGDIEVDLYAKINNVGEERMFNSAELVKLNNNGIVDEAYSDYDYQTISGWTQFGTTLIFTYPGNSNQNLESMRVEIGDKEVNLIPKAQSIEEYDGFAGVYKASSGAVSPKYVVESLGGNEYRLYQYNSMIGLEIHTVTIGKNNVYSYDYAREIYVADEHAIYPANEEGQPKRDSFCLIKANSVIQSQDSNNTFEKTTETQDSSYSSQSGSQETGDTSDSEYMLPNSDSEYISDSDLDGLTPDECRLALNEIYARHGRKFNDPDYQAYFNSKSWYNGTIDPDDFDDTAMFNQYELANRDYIIDYEKRMGYR